MPETSAEMLARVLHKQGGHILLVGGGVEDLHLRDHPQLLLWDDRYAEWMNKEIPTNTRAIIWNRFVSHAKVAKLNVAAEKLRAVKFPNLRPREIKELLSVFLQPAAESSRDLGPTPWLETPLEPPPPTETTETPTEERIESIMRKPNRGEMKDILKAELDQAAPIPTAEAKRLMPIIKSKYGIQLTKSALVQHILKQKGRLKLSRPRGSGEREQVRKRPVSKATEADTFVEAEKMLQDAMAAISLLMEFIPKLKAETAELRAKQAKIKALIED